MIRAVALALSWAAALMAQTGFPFAAEELSYTVSAPGGLIIGRAHTKALRASAQWQFEVTLEAGFANFGIQDTYKSSASADLCSAELEKRTLHGRRSTVERTTFDAHAGLATRRTENGGKSELPIGPCTRDALTFLYYVRREMGQGRVPPPHAVLFGALYDLRLEYGGAQSIESGKQKVETDRLLATAKGPAGSHTFEVYFARDAARTPLRARIPLPVGIFALDLVR